MIDLYGFVVNFFGDGAVAKLAEALQETRSLTELDLQGFASLSFSSFLCLSLFVNVFFL